MSELDIPEVPKVPEFLIPEIPMIDGDWAHMIAPSPCIIPQEIKLEIDRELIPKRIEVCWSQVEKEAEPLDTTPNPNPHGV